MPSWKSAPLESEVSGEVPKWKNAPLENDNNLSMAAAFGEGADQGVTFGTFDEARGVDAAIEDSPWYIRAPAKALQSVIRRTPGGRVAVEGAKGGAGVGAEMGLDVGFSLGGGNRLQTQDLVMGTVDRPSFSESVLPESYRATRDAERANIARAREDRPLSTMAGEIVGGMAAPVSSFQNANRARQVVGPLMPRLVQGGKEGAKIGASYGALYGLTSSDGDASDRIEGASEGALGGAISGAVLGAGMPALGDALKSVSRRFSGGPRDTLEFALGDGDDSVSARAGSSIIKALESAGASREDIVRALTSFNNGQNGGQTRLTLASHLKATLGETNPKVGETIDNVVIEFREQFADLVKGRISDIQQQQQEKFNASLDDIAFKEGTAKRAARLGEELSDIGAELYQPSIARGPVDAQAGEELSILIRKVIPKSYLNLLTARRILDVDPSTAIGGGQAENAHHISIEQIISDNPLRVAHEVYSYLGKLSRAAVGSEKIGFEKIRTLLRDPLMRAGGKEYQKANRDYAKVVQSREALDFGKELRRAARSQRETEEMARRFLELPAGQIRNSALMSIRDEISDAARAARDGDLIPLTNLRKEGFMDAIERVLPVRRGVVQPRNGMGGATVVEADPGSDTIGRQLVAEIRALIQESGDVKAWSKSAKKDQLKAGRRAYAGPLGEGAYAGDTMSFGNLVQDGAVSAVMGQPVPLKMASTLGQKAAASLVSPAKRVRQRMAESLLSDGSRQRPIQTKAPPQGPNGGHSPNQPAPSSPTPGVPAPTGVVTQSSAPRVVARGGEATRQAGGQEPPPMRVVSRKPNPGWRGQGNKPTSSRSSAPLPDGASTTVEPPIVARMAKATEPGTPQSWHSPQVVINELSAGRNAPGPPPPEGYRLTQELRDAANANDVFMRVGNLKINWTDRALKMDRNQKAQIVVRLHDSVMADDLDQAASILGEHFDLNQEGIGMATKALRRSALNKAEEVGLLPLLGEKETVTVAPGRGGTAKVRRRAQAKHEKQMAKVEQRKLRDAAKIAKEQAKIEFIRQREAIRADRMNVRNANKSRTEQLSTDDADLEGFGRALVGAGAGLGATAYGARKLVQRRRRLAFESAADAIVRAERGEIDQSIATEYVNNIYGTKYMHWQQMQDDPDRAIEYLDVLVPLVAARRQELDQVTNSPAPEVRKRVKTSTH